MIKIFLLLLIVVIYFHFRIRTQEKQLRILTTFVAGLFSKAVRGIEIHENITPSRRELYKDSLAYKEMLRVIGAYLQEDYWEKPYRNLLLHDWNLFYNNGMANDGFDAIYKDLIISQAKEVLGESSSWFSEKEKNWLRRLVKHNEDINKKLRDALKDGRDNFLKKKDA